MINMQIPLPNALFLAHSCTCPGLPLRWSEAPVTCMVHAVILDSSFLLLLNSGPKQICPDFLEVEKI